MVSQLAARRCRSLDVIGIGVNVPSVIRSRDVRGRVDVITEIDARVRQSIRVARCECDPLAGIAALLRFVSVGRDAAACGGVSVLVEERSRVSVLAPSDPARPCVADARDGFALVVTEGESPGRRIAVGTAPVVIGRGVGVDLQIRDLTVSRHHCVVGRAAGRCWVRDLGSTNQTRVNNRCARVAEIFEGDVLLVGQTAMTLTLAPRVDAA